jgi:hypothetical protein
MAASSQLLPLEQEEAARESPSLYRRLRRAACALLSAGPVPRHLAFIMDGNRRFAAQLGVDKATGHARGFETVRYAEGAEAQRSSAPHAPRSCWTRWSGVLTLV